VKILFDTSALVAAMVAPHPSHERSLPWLARARAGEFDWCVCTHTLVELCAVLTTLPVSPRIGPLVARRMIHENVQSRGKLVALTPADYVHVIGALSELGLSGGAIYDALIRRAARKAGADRLLTLNPRDLQRLSREGSPEIVTP
jgi:predicted nucleic acid-binding protein